VSRKTIIELALVVLVIAAALYLLGTQ